MKYIGVLRDTARAPKPTTQYNTIQYQFKYSSDHHSVRT